SLRLLSKRLNGNSAWPSKPSSSPAIYTLSLHDALPISERTRSMNARILVVDDDPAIAEMIGIILRGEGYDPLFAADGKAAIDSFRGERPDLVLLDLMLPGMS